mmetsp:Transcript_3546/g.6487  ORF Transcript_3546/g.6487 Transcript_3546/m.6487 type:complete len:231 (-) Transcript_3546:54-746(-)
MNIRWHKLRCSFCLWDNSSNNNIAPTMPGRKSRPRWKHRTRHPLVVRSGPSTRRKTPLGPTTSVHETLPALTKQIPFMGHIEGTSSRVFESSPSERLGSSCFLNFASFVPIPSPSWPLVLACYPEVLSAIIYTCIHLPLALLTDRYGHPYFTFMTTKRGVLCVPYYSTPRDNQKGHPIDCKREWPTTTTASHIHKLCMHGCMHACTQLYTKLLFQLLAAVMFTYHCCRRC